MGLSRFSRAVGSTLSVLASRLLTDLKEKKKENLEKNTVLQSS